MRNALGILVNVITHVCGVPSEDFKGFVTVIQKSNAHLNLGLQNTNRSGHPTVASQHDNLTCAQRHHAS